MGGCSTLVTLDMLGVVTRFFGLNSLCQSCICRSCCHVLGKWLFFPMYCSIDFLQTLLIRVNGLLYVVPYIQNYNFACNCVWVWNVVAQVEGVPRLKVLENRALRSIFGPNTDNITGEWRRLQNWELNNLYSSLRRGAYRVLVGTHDERYQLEDQGIVGRIMLKWIFGKWDRSKDWFDLAEVRDNLVPLVNAVIYLQVFNCGQFLAEILLESSRTLLY